jgi:hypothetical protein
MTHGPASEECPPKRKSPVHNREACSGAGKAKPDQRQPRHRRSDREWSGSEGAGEGRLLRSRGPAGAHFRSRRTGSTQGRIGPDDFRGAIGIVACLGFNGPTFHLRCAIISSTACAIARSPSTISTNSNFGASQNLRLRTDFGSKTSGRSRFAAKESTQRYSCSEVSLRKVRSYEHLLHVRVRANELVHILL